MRAGDLRDRITIDSLQVAKGTSGGMQKAWVLHTTVWAKRMDYSGAERRASSAGGEVAVARVEFLIRVRDDLLETMRVRHRGKAFNIRHIKPLANARGWMVLTCDMGMNDG